MFIESSYLAMIFLPASDFGVESIGEVTRVPRDKKCGRKNI